MSTHESMTPLSPERLDEIQERLDAAKEDPPPEEWSYGAGVAWVPLCEHAPQDLADLMAEVQRLQRFKSIVSWRYGDTTDGRTREDMTERAARALYLRESDWSSEAKWDRLPEFVRESWRKTACAVLDAALGTGEGA